MRKTSEQLCLRNKLAPFPNRSLTKWPDWLPVPWCVRRWGSRHQEQTVHRAEQLEVRHRPSVNNSSSWRLYQFSFLLQILKPDPPVLQEREEKKRKTRICLVLLKHFWPKSVWWAVASLRRVLEINSNIIISFLNSLHNGRIWDYYTFWIKPNLEAAEGTSLLPAQVHLAALGMKTLKTWVQSHSSWLNSIYSSITNINIWHLISESISLASRLCLSLFIPCEHEYFLP